jgi:hypothetical protein
MKLLHYGLQRSGTNFLESYLRKKYKIKFLNSNKDRKSPLQKHFRLYSEKYIVPEPQYQNNILISNFYEFESLFNVLPDYYIIISKDPYSWYLSYKRWATKCNWPKVNHHYIEEYNLFYGTFLEFSTQTKKIRFIRYVDLLGNMDGLLHQLELDMSLEKRMLPVFGLRSHKVSQSEAFTDERKAYYLNEQYLKEYSKKELQTLNDALDLGVAASLGYEIKR